MTDLRVATRTGGETTLDANAVEGLRSSLRGRLLPPLDPAYEEARKVNNGMHDRRPALIVQAAGVADVLAVVRFAGAHDLLLAVRGGGHGVAGFGTTEGGVVLDLGRMRGVRVDPGSRTVRAEGGCTWGDLDHATNAFGLATTGGIVSTTGIGGLTLGGGMGYLARRCGLTCDNLLSADVVTADGRFVTCDADRDSDLFWAIRGGGGNFGVVTCFELRLHDVDGIVGGPTFYRIDEEVLRRYRDFILDAPEELGAIFAFVKAPPLPFLPPDWHGKPAAAVIACWSGEAGRAETALSPLGDLGDVVGSHVGSMPYSAINRLFDPLLPPGLRQYWKGSFVDELGDEAIEAHVEPGSKVPTIESGTHFFPLDGACQRVAPDATAFAYRDVDFATVIAAAWHERSDDASIVRWVRDYDEALRPFSQPAGYVNFLAEEDRDRVPVSYGDNYRRLVHVKSRYDPRNLFRINHNIPPA